MQRNGIFVGSFDPFTIGHDNIVRRALPLFDKLVIGVVGDNVNKQYLQPAEERMKTIAQLYAHEPRVEVKPFYGLAVDFAKANNARFIVKGVRSVKDYEYELQQADINREIGGIDTLLLTADPQLASISSTLVRELAHFNQDISRFLPTQDK